MTDKQLLKTATQFTKGLLGNKGNRDKCYVVCAPLSAYLNFLGIYNQMEEGWLLANGVEYHHWWIRLSDGIIIDPTASQFNSFKGLESHSMPPIYIGEKPDWYEVILGDALMSKN